MRTTFTYDAFSLVTSVKNARNHTSTINRNAVTGNVESVVNHLGHTSTMEYDTRGLVTRSVFPNGQVSEFDYNAQGLPERKTETPPTGTPGAVRVRPVRGQFFQASGVSSSKCACQAVD